jgi:hypothetical protein
MKQDFATDVAPGQAKEWAGKRADQIEAELALLRPEVEAAMARLRPRGEKHAAERLAAKQTQRRLDDGPPQMCDLDLRRVRAAAASPIGCRLTDRLPSATVSSACRSRAGQRSLTRERPMISFMISVVPA